MFTRQLKLAFQNFLRNFWLSLATIVIILLSLFSVSILFGLNALASEAINILEEKISISLYLKPEVGLEKATEIKTAIESYPQVSGVYHIAKEEALESFREKHKDNELILQSLNEIEKNPLGDTLIIKSNNASAYPEIIGTIENAEYKDLIENKKFNEEYKSIITRLDELSKSIRWIMLGLIGLFILISTLIIINTIRITIYTYREEIGIMRLVGATQGFIQSPFLMQSFFYGLVAWGVHLAILFPIISALQPYINNFVGSDGINLVQYFTQHFVVIFGGELVGVLLLTLLSSAIAMRKYLKV
ncbi:MAG: permease-like cell division protein FtsX [Patescibacteria group bacterium]